MIPLADFQPLSAAKTNRGFTERYFSDKVRAIIEEVSYKLRCVTASVYLK